MASFEIANNASRDIAKLLPPWRVVDEASVRWSDPVLPEGVLRCLRGEVGV